MKFGMKLLMLGMVVIATAACSGIPGSSGVHEVSRVADQVSESAAPAPVAGSSPGVIVTNFIQAAVRVSSTGAVGSVFDAPAQYLTAKARESWKTRPPITVQILANAPRVDTGDGGTVVISGPSEGTIDVDKAFHPGNGASIKVTLHLVQENGQWRISDPPTALLIQVSDFNRAYAARTVYFLDASHTVVVPDRRYLVAGTAKNRVSALVDLLLAGPAGVLKGAAQSELTGAALRTAVTTDSDGVAHVDLLGVDLPKPADEAALAAQIVWTLYPDVAQVSITVNGALLAPQPYTRQALESFSPDRVPGTGQVVSDPYFIDVGGRIVDLLTNTPLNGRLGTGSPNLVSAAMSAATGTVAAVSQTGGRQTLLIGQVVAGTSAPASPENTQSALQADMLTQPSFNRTGDEVWVVQNGDGKNPEIYQVSTSAAANASGVPSRAKIAVNGLDGKGDVTGLVLSPDGVRVVIVAGQQLYMGAIASSAATPKPGSTTTDLADAPDTLSVINLQPIRGELSQVGAVAFSSATQVLAVGRDTGSAPPFRSITEMDVDGFDSSQLTSTGLNNDVQSLAVSNVSAVAASPTQTTPAASPALAPTAAQMYVVYGPSNQAGQIAALSGSPANGLWQSPSSLNRSNSGLSVFFPN